MSPPPANRLCREHTLSNPPTPVINVHISGDVLILVGSGEEEKFIRVSSGILTAASGFFVDLFAANLQENKSSFSTTISERSAYDIRRSSGHARPLQHPALP